MRRHGIFSRAGVDSRSVSQLAHCHERGQRPDAGHRVRRTEGHHAVEAQGSNKTAGDPPAVALGHPRVGGPRCSRPHQRAAPCRAHAHAAADVERHLRPRAQRPARGDPGGRHPDRCPGSRRQPRQARAQHRRVRHGLPSAGGRVQRDQPADRQPDSGPGGDGPPSPARADPLVPRDDEPGLGQRAVGGGQLLGRHRLAGPDQLPPAAVRDGERHRRHGRALAVGGEGQRRPPRDRRGRHHRRHQGEDAARGDMGGPGVERAVGSVPQLRRGVHDRRRRLRPACVRQGAAGQQLRGIAGHVHGAGFDRSPRRPDDAHERLARPEHGPAHRAAHRRAAVARQRDRHRLRTGPIAQA